MTEFVVGIVVGWLSLAGFLMITKVMHKMPEVQPTWEVNPVIPAVWPETKLFTVIGGDGVAIYAGNNFAEAKAAFFQTHGTVRMLAGNNVVRER